MPVQHVLIAIWRAFFDLQCTRQARQSCMMQDAGDAAAWAAVIIAALAFLLGAFNFYTSWRANQNEKTDRDNQRGIEAAERQALQLQQRNAWLHEANRMMAVWLYGGRNNLVKHFCSLDYSTLDASDQFGNVDKVKEAHDRIPLCNSGQPVPDDVILVELHRACIAAHTLYPYVRAAKSRTVQLPKQLPKSVPAWKVLDGASTALELWSKILAVQEKLPGETWTGTERSRANAFVCMCLPFKAVHWRLIASEGNFRKSDWATFKSAFQKSLSVGESSTAETNKVRTIMQDLLGIGLP